MFTSKQQEGTGLRKIIDKILSLSVSIQVIIVIAALVLPINIIAIVYTMESKSAFLQQSLNAASHSAELYMNELDERIYSANSYIFEDINKNPYILKLRSHEQGEAFRKEATYYWNELNNRT